jgi:hypothetical protein
VRRIGVLSAAREIDTIDGRLLAAFRQALQTLGWSVTGDPFHQQHVDRIIRFLADNGIPGMVQIRENVLAGGLMSYDASLPACCDLCSKYFTGYQAG